MSRLCTSSPPDSDQAWRVARITIGTELYLFIGKNPDRGGRPWTASGASSFSMPVALTGHGGRGNCANGIAVETVLLKAGREHAAQREMHFAKNKVVRLVHPDLNSRLMEVLAIQVLHDLHRPTRRRHLRIQKLR